MHGFDAFYRRVIMLLAELLSRHDRLIASAAKAFGEIRFYTPCFQSRLSFAFPAKSAFQAVCSSLHSLFPTIYAKTPRLVQSSYFMLSTKSFLPLLLIQRGPISPDACRMFCRALRAERLVRLRVLLAASRANTVCLAPMVCFPRVHPIVFPRSHRPSPHRINSGVDGRAIPLDLLRRESPTPIGITKNLDKLLHACCLCHKTTSSYCASISTHLHILT